MEPNQTVTINTSTPPSSDQNYAGFGVRFLAYIVDAFLLTLVGMVVGFGIGMSMGFKASTSSGFNFNYYLPSLVISALYFIIFWMKEGQTPGHKVMALKVIRTDGHPIDFPTGLIRYFGFLLSSIVLYLGFIWIIFDSKKQGWADKMAGTVVVKTGEKPKTWIPVTLIVLYVLLVLVGIFMLTVGIIAAGALMSKNPKLSSALQGKQTVSENSSVSVDELVSELPTAINDYRTSKKLSPLTSDQQLCAYAQKRADYLETLGKNDDGRQFYEDLANPTMAQAYFNKFTTAGSVMYKFSGNVPTATKLVEIWSMNSKNGTAGVIDSDKYTHGCARASQSFVVLITAQGK